MYNIYPRVVARPTYPAIMVVPSDDTTAKPQTTGGMFCWYIDVYVMVAYTEMEEAQDQLDDELSPDVIDSVMHVLRRNPTLGNVVMDSTPIAVMNYGPAEAGEAGGAPFIGAQIRLEVREC